MKIPRFPALRRLAAGLFVLLALVPPGAATWSIVIVNTDTGEACVATATCLTNFDIQTAVPVIVVGKGAGAAQALVNSSASNKIKIFNGLQNDLTPAAILSNIIATDGAIQVRQFGIVNFTGVPRTFTGTAVGIGKKGLVGIAGPLRYAAQGNVLTGPEVIDAIEVALLNTPGDLGQKVMAAMEAARALGGDGRCSCSIVFPTSCGVPPPSFTKSAHVGTVIISRIGDTDGTCGPGVGCVTGDYYLDLNVIGGSNDPDPVFTLQTQYDAWRASLAGHPDGVLSTVEVGAEALVADGQTQTTVTIQLKDVEDAPITSGGAAVTVTPQGPGAPSSTVSAVTDNANGTYSFTLTAGTQAGSDLSLIHI